MRVKILFIVLLLLLISFTGVLLLQPRNCAAYPTHAPITIYSNSAFNVSNGVVSGSGTPGDPYIMEKYEISAVTGHGIDIRNTDAHFIIRFVNVTNGQSNSNDGIFLSNVTNGRIENVSSVNNYDGIEISDSRNITVVNSKMTDNYRGITLSQASRYNEIAHNNASLNTQQNIALFGVFYNNISHNSVYRSQTGIYLSDSDFNNITFNKIWNYSLYDIYLQQSHDNNISSNYVRDSVFYGIYTLASLRNNIHNNTVSETVYGIYLFSGSAYNVVDGNTVLDNWAGINMRISSYDTVINNHVERNSQYGIYTLGTSHTHIIKYNHVTGCGFAINFQSATSGNTVTGNTAVNNYAGVNFVTSGDTNVVKHNNMTGNEVGIYLGTSGNNIVVENNISAGDQGIVLDECTSFNNISSNIIETMSETGIHLLSSGQAYLAGNEMTGCGIFMDGTGKDHWNTHTITVSNQVNQKPVYYWKDRTGGEVPAGAGQLILANCKDIIVDGLQFASVSCGLELGFSDGVIITDVNASYNSLHGIYSIHSFDNSVKNSICEYNGLNGIYIHSGSTDNTLDFNVLYRNGESGIVVKDSDRNEITNTTLRSNSDSGILLYNSDVCSVKENHFRSNAYGLRLESSDDNIVNNNTFSSNENGIALYSSNYNLIYHNTIRSNINQSIDDGSTSSWNYDYPTCGNYWDDYAGVDQKSGSGQNKVGSDGIGDTAYTIDFNSRDQYPLMQPLVYVEPGAPQNLNATAGDGFVVLKWDPPVYSGSFPVHSYRIYRKSMPYVMEHLTTVGNATTYNDTSVFNGLSYDYELSAVSIVGEGPVSEMVTAIPLAPIPPDSVPSEPVNPMAVPDSDGEDHYINLTWNPPLSPGSHVITNYTVYRGTRSGNLTLLTRIGNLTGYLDMNILKGVTYYYGVRAVNEVGEGPLSLEVSAVVITAPGAPLNLRVKVGNQFVHLSWSPPGSDGGSPIFQYNVYRSTTANRTDPMLIISRSQTNYNDTGLKNGVTYYYRVRAENIIDLGPYSEEVSATPILVNLPPSIEISVNVSTGFAPLTVQFNSSGLDPDGLIVSYAWNFGDGGTSAERNPVYTFLVVGTYNVTLQVEDNRGATSVVNLTVRVDKRPEIPGPGPDEVTPDDTDESIPFFETRAFYAITGFILLMLVVAAILIVISRRRKRELDEASMVYQPPPPPPPVEDHAEPVYAEVTEGELEE